MNADYVKDVYRFGSGGRLKDANGEPFNVSHNDDCSADEIRTDGTGNIIGSPLIWKKPCIGRPERHVRGLYGGKPLRGEGGERRTSDTPCDRCSNRSPGVFEACGRVVDERIASNPAIGTAFDDWMTARGEDFGAACFTGSRLKPWRAYLDAIIAHGGWTNINDDQVKFERIRKLRDDQDRRNAAARATRRQRRMARRGAPTTPTVAYRQALQTERDRRAETIKGFGRLSGRSPRDMLWLRNLTLESCERIADVWSSRELLSFGGGRVTCKAIAEHMIGNAKDYKLGLPSLTSRVCQDLKRIAKFEDSRAGAPIWSRWTYIDQSKG